MNRKYSIEVPIYATSLDHLIELNRSEIIRIILYGGVPNSPLNGGRYNVGLDGLILTGRLFVKITHRQYVQALSKFYATITKANQHGISFRIAYTNMFVDPADLTKENLDPIKKLAASGEQYGVKNGLIINNKFLEDSLRQTHGDKLEYVGSCTKYYSPDKILSPAETLKLYLEESGKYNAICLTPQDSRRPELIKSVLAKSLCPVIAISNTYCSDRCNSYDHYVHISKENKKSLVTAGAKDILWGILSFIKHRQLARNCSAMRHVFCKVNIEKFTRMQLNAGIINFKLGRGFGDNAVNLLVKLIDELNTSRPA